MNTLQHRAFGAVFVTISAVLFSLYGVFSRYLASYDVFFQTYVRSLLIAGLLFLFGHVQKSFIPIQKKDYPWMFFVLFVTCFTIVPIVYAFRYISLGTTSFVFYASMTVFSYIFGLLFFQEKMTRSKIVSLGCSFLGLTFIFYQSFTSLLVLPILLTIINGFASSAEVTFSKKISGTYSSTQITMLVFLVIGITHLVFSLIIGEKQDFSILTQSFRILMAFTITSIVAMVTVVEGFKRLEPSVAALIGLSEILFSVIIGYIFFEEHLEISSIIGGAFIVVAVALPNIHTYLLDRKEKSSYN